MTMHTVVRPDVRAHRPPPPQGPLLRGLERFMARNRDRLVFVHLVMFFGFLVLMTVPLWLPMPGDSATFYDNFTLFANFVIWGLWFPLVFVSVVFTGRSWCGLLCPLGACSEWANGIGLKRRIPRWVRWQGTPVISFVLITVLAQTVDARGFPQGIAVVFGLAFACAIILGFVYGPGKAQRPWCRHMCPIGLMLGVFSRIGAVQFAPKRPRPGGEAYAEKGICPTMIDINRKTESRHCIECFRCVHPQSRGGLRLVLRRPGAEVADIREHNPNAAEVAFLFIATGLSLGGFLWLILPQYERWRETVGTWAINRGWYWIGTAGPSWLMSVHPAGREVYTWLDFFMISGFMLACAVMITAVLGALTALSSWMAGRAGADRDFRRRFVEQAYAYMPVAMVSLVIGLGSELFEGLKSFGLSAPVVADIKATLFTLGVIWSVGLGLRLLGVQGLAGARRWLALLPLVAGSAFIGAAWWPAIFGL
ncbi:MAG: 4Fe-4S binding protein [Pseudomonadota bacterium]|nr:4Fe-4S binding protein [Pseudomonadota bacterium]